MSARYYPLLAARAASLSLLLAGCGSAPPAAPPPAAASPLAAQAASAQPEDIDTESTISTERQQRSPTGQWSDAPIARDAIAELESAVLLRARHIRAERYRDTS